MSSEIRQFLQLPKEDIATMSQEDLAMEVEGWRAVMGTLPVEQVQWLARMHEEVRFTLRNYTNHAGILLGVKLEPVEYTVYEQALAFDSIRGMQMLEDKEVRIPANGVAYIEFVDDAKPWTKDDEDADLAKTSLEV